MVATYLVTGASRGIGFELTKQLLARGDHVIAAVRDPSKASALKSLPNAANLDIVKIDVEHPESIKVRSFLSVVSCLRSADTRTTATANCSVLTIL